MQSIFASRLNMPKVPPNLEKAAEFFVKHVMEEIVQGPPPGHLIAYTIGPARPMRWELAGAPSPPDDLVRAIAEHERAFVVALVHPTAVPSHVQADRAWRITSEDAGRRVDVMIALRGTTATGGGEHFQILQANPGPQPARWVGVASETVSVAEQDEGFHFGPVGQA